MRIALIGDIHTFSLKLHPRRMLSRRVMGQSNLWLNRRFRFNHLLLEIVIEKVREAAPDLVLLSGDVTTTSLEDEFLDIKRYLHPLAERFRTVLVPGNHDRYTFRSARDQRIEQLLEGLLPPEFPHLEALSGRWRLLALDSASPQWMLSRGALGPTQMEGALEHLRALGEGEGLVVLCHYPVATPTGVPNSWAHALAEKKALQHALRDCAARVVFVHGHIHKPWYWAPADALENPADHAVLAEAPALDRSNSRKPAPFTTINAGAPCLTSGDYPLGQGFWQITLPDDSAAALELIHQVPRPEGNAHRNLPRRQRRQSVPEEVRWEARRVL